MRTCSKFILVDPIVDIYRCLDEVVRLLKIKEDKKVGPLLCFGMIIQTVR